jgi:hypothetical protein
LLPPEHRLEHSSNAVTNLTDEQLDAMIEHIQSSQACRWNDAAVALRRLLLSSEQAQAPEEHRGWGAGAA